MSYPRAPARQRRIARRVPGQATSDGAGVRLTRSLGSRALLQLDPFLLLDEFRNDDPQAYIAGFPPHPHRGFETVTYMLAGHMRHEDSLGNTGHLGPGAVQWMSAASGIIHAEMPEQEDGLLWGFQLWVNLPAAEKMGAPRYQDIAAEQIPEGVDADGVRLRVIAGRSEIGGRPLRGPVQPRASQPLYLDISLPAGTAFEQPLPAAHNALVYPVDGAPLIAGEALAERELAVLGEGDAVRIEAGPAAARALLIAGRPLGEPISRYGPFVMNTHEEIQRALDDYRRGELLRPQGQ